MSLNKVQQIKVDKGFRFADLIIYGVIAAIAAVLFLWLFLWRNVEPLAGVRIFIGEDKAFEYDFSSGEFLVSDDRLSVEEADDGIRVRIDLGEDGYNVVEIDTEERSVRVTDADCVTKDCVYTPAITDSGGIIYCSPHSVRIEPFGYNSDDDHIIM